MIILFAFAYSMYVSAQKHEFSLYYGGGISAISSNLLSGNNIYGKGRGDFGLGYTYFFNERLGIHTGAGLGLYTADITLNDYTYYTVADNMTDNDGKHYHLHTMLNRYSEFQEALYLNIPLMVQLQKHSQQGFYVIGGIKIGVPFGMGNFGTMDKLWIVNSAFYPEEGTGAPLQEFRDSDYFDGNIDIGLSCIIALEAGMKWKVGDRVLLYTGVYFDYGQNNIVKDNAPFVRYAPEFDLNGILSSNLATNVRPFALGVKLRLALKTTGKS